MTKGRTGNRGGAGVAVRWIGRSVLLAGIVTGPGAAGAMAGLLLLDPPPEAGTRWSAGVSTWRLHTLPGDGARDRAWWFPALEGRWADGLFVSTDTGLGWNLSSDPATQAGWRLSPWPGRTTADLRVGARLEQGLFLNRALGDSVLWQNSVRHGSARGRDGWISETGLTSGLPLPRGEVLGVTVGCTWANGRYRSSYDGIGAALPGGWQDLQAALSYEHRLDARWRVDGQWLTARTVGLRHGAAGNATQRAVSLSLWRDLR